MASRNRDEVLIVGSGINSLVCAALLARAGRAVRVLEREAVLGGCVRSDALTLPGFVTPGHLTIRGTRTPPS